MYAQSCSLLTSTTIFISDHELKTVSFIRLSVSLRLSSYRWTLKQRKRNSWSLTVRRFLLTMSSSISFFFSFISVLASLWLSSLWWASTWKKKVTADRIKSSGTCLINRQHEMKMNDQENPSSCSIKRKKKNTGAWARSLGLLAACRLAFCWSRETFSFYHPARILSLYYCAGWRKEIRSPTEWYLP